MIYSLSYDGVLWYDRMVFRLLVLWSVMMIMARTMRTVRTTGTMMKMMRMVMIVKMVRTVINQEEKTLW